MKQRTGHKAQGTGRKSLTVLRDRTTQVSTPDVAMVAADVVRVIAKNVITAEQRDEVLAVWFESRNGQAMLRNLEKHLGLALVPVEMIDTLLYLK